ncbi:MAG TPA: hypothetical protein PKV97_00155 [Thauera aminoaromatica]|nr:hypothetical protein [Thauera aminoaromatica]
MAYQVPSASAPHANIVAAINGNHASVDSTGKSHWDSTEIDPSGTELYISVPDATDFLTGVAVVNAAKSLYNTHRTYSNAGINTHIYAHLNSDTTNVVTTADMDGTSLYNTMFQAIKTLYLEIRTAYVNHINNKKPDQTTAAYHTDIDTVDVLGAVPTINDEADLAVDMNNCKAQYNLHIVNTTGVHGASDAGNAITAANAVQGNLDTFITLVNQMKTKINAHFATAGMVHTGAFGADNQNTIVGAAVSYPAGLFTLINEIYTDYEAHRADATLYHQVADATNVLTGGYYPVTTLAGFVTAAQEQKTKINAHFRNAPAYSRAVRVV